MNIRSHRLLVPEIIEESLNPGHRTLDMDVYTIIPVLNSAFQPVTMGHTIYKRPKPYPLYQSFDM